MFANMAIVRDILLGAEKQSGQLRQMCAELAIDPSNLYQSDLPVSFENAVKAWTVALKYSEDPYLGLHLGEQTNPLVMGLVGHLMQSCPNLEEAFKAACNFSRLATDMMNYSLSSSNKQLKLSYHPATPWVKIAPISARHAVEHSMSGSLTIFKMMSGRKVVPERVQLQYPRPKILSEYERIFQSPIQWNASSNSMIFSPDQLMIPVLSYDESLMGLFCNLIEKRFLKLRNETFENQVRREIMTTFMGQLPSIESMAARFHLTVRSFQRKLKNEQTSYRKLCHEMGKDFASALLANPKVNIGEVAAALGYSDPRAFQRAFKLWTGQTPSQFRELL